MNNQSEFGLILERMWKKKEYKKIVDTLINTKQQNEEEYFLWLLRLQTDKNTKKFPVKIFIEIADGQTTKPLEKRIIWFMNWTTISPEIAHVIFWGEIYENLKDDSKSIEQFIYFYCSDVLPRFIEIKKFNLEEIADLVEKIKGVIIEQIINKHKIGELYSLLAMVLIKHRMHENAYSLIENKMNYIKDIWTLLIPIGNNVSEPIILEKVLVACETLLLELKKNDSIKYLVPKMKRFLLKVIDVFENMETDIEELKLLTSSIKNTDNNEAKLEISQRIEDLTKKMKDIYPYPSTYILKFIEKYKLLKDDNNSDEAFLIQGVNEILSMDSIRDEKLYQIGQDLNAQLRQNPYKEQISELEKIISDMRNDYYEKLMKN